MKQLFFILSVVLGIAIQGYPQSSGIRFVYEVVSIKRCVFIDGELFERKATDYPGQYVLTVETDSDEITVYAHFKEPVMIANYRILGFERIGNCVVYTVEGQHISDKATRIAFGITKENTVEFTFFEDDQILVYEVELLYNNG